LAGCLAFAALFDNTCTDLENAVSFSSIPSETISCTGDVGYCPGTSSGSTCTWTRKLCVTCSLVSSVPYIRIQTNSLPNRCFYAGSDTPKSIEIDYTVKFNWDVSSTTTTVASVSDADTANCATKTAYSRYIPSSASFTNTGTSLMLEAMGVSLDGILINPAINAD
jgi:hypothetical protein